MQRPYFFLALVFLTGLVPLIFGRFAYRKTKDVLHPSLFIGLLLFGVYSFIPFYLVITDPIGLQAYLTISQLEFVQLFNLCGVTLICVGLIKGSRLFGRDKKSCYFQYLDYLDPVFLKKIRSAAIVCGLLGVVGYALGIINSGGFIEAYSRAYGGGWDDSGYVRDAFWLTLPALIWFMISRSGKSIKTLDIALYLLLSSPLMLQGLLGARRGPTFSVLFCLFLGWYFANCKRPKMSRFLASGCGIIFLMLALVTNRGEIYIGSDFDFRGVQESYTLQASSGNEFIYGAATIIHAKESNNFFYGRRLFIQVFVRAIPRVFWPNKYADASRYLGLSRNLEENVGVDRQAFIDTVGWIGPRGAAQGLIADAWLEFSWFAFFALFVIGYFYGWFWHKAMTQALPWMPVYILAASFSVYLVTQSLNAFAFRFLLTLGASWLIWRCGPYASFKLSKSWEESRHSDVD